ncbi:MAG: hypothetical protein ACI376_04915 [Candidatus Bruticola sp.]
MSVILTRALQVFLRKRLNNYFDYLIREGDLDQAQSHFKDVINIAPSFIEYNETLLQAAEDLHKVNSKQSIHNLENCFNKIADIYLDSQPESSFANIVAAGIKKRSNPVLAKKCLIKAVNSEKSSIVLSAGSFIARDFDNCLSVLLALGTLNALKKDKNFDDKSLFFTIFLIQALNCAGANHSAEHYLKEWINSHDISSLDRETTAYVLDYQAQIKQLIGRGMTCIDSLTNLNHADFYTPYLFFHAILICLANHQSLKACQLIQAITSYPDLELPLWFGDSLKNYAAVISYITNLYNEGKREADPDSLDIHLKNLKDIAHTYHNIKYVQILAADAHMCAGKYNQALIYLERAKQLPWSLIIEADIIDDQEQYELSEHLICSLAKFYLSGNVNITMALYTAQTNNGDDSEALALAEQRLRNNDFSSPLLKAVWLFCAARSSKRLGLDIQSLMFETQCEDMLDAYSEDNHIDGEPIPHEDLIATLSSPRSFGPPIYHFLRGALAAEHNESENACIYLQKALPERPNFLPALRLLGRQAYLTKNLTAARLVLDNLKLFYTSIEDLQLMSNLEKIID